MGHDSDINFLISNSGEMEIENIDYNGRMLKLYCYFGEMDEFITLNINTKKIAFQEMKFGLKIPILCHLKIDDLKSLDISNGYYVPNATFGKMMKECKSHLSLAYGEKLDSCMLLKIQSDAPVISCLINNLSDISYELVTEVEK